MIYGGNLPEYKLDYEKFDNFFLGLAGRTN